MDGVPGARIKDKVAALEARKVELTAELEKPHEATVLLHPKMSEHYRTWVALLRESLVTGNAPANAAEIVRSLIERVELTRVTQDGKTRLAIKLHGDLAGIFSPASKKPALVSEGGLGVDKVGCGGQI